MPLRPQAIFILGTNFVTRTIINTIISIASLFTSEKVLDRVRFADLDEVKTKIPDSSMPKPLQAVDDHGQVHTLEQHRKDIWDTMQNPTTLYLLIFVTGNNVCSGMLATTQSYVGGGSLLDTTDKVLDWMRERLRNFHPLPDLFPEGA
jgi:hypothetical protein